MIQSTRSTPRGKTREPWIGARTAAMAATLAAGMLCAPAAGAQSAPPLVVPTAPVVLPISRASAANHTCLRRDDGTVLCWGENAQGQLGDGTFGVLRSVPSPVLDASGAPFDRVSQVSVGGGHTCAVRTDGTVWCWGVNDHGQLGKGRIDPYSTAPTAVDNFRPAQVAGLSDIAEVRTGYRHSCALQRITGKVFCWGLNDGGQAGGPTPSDLTTPVAVMAGNAPLSNVAGLALGGQHSCALKTNSATTLDTSTYCWGYGFWGQLGFWNNNNPTFVPNAGRVNGLTTITRLALGLQHTCAIDGADGSVLCWGFNDRGQLGRGITSSTQTNIAPMQVRYANGVLLTGMTDVGASWAASCVVHGASHTEWCWGDDRYGILADGAHEDGVPMGAGTLSAVPVQAADVTGAPVTGAQWVSMGADHQCNRHIDGSLWCAGRNYAGQLGDGTVMVGLAGGRHFFSRVLLP